MPVDPQCQTILEAAAAKGAPFAHDDVHASRAAYAGTTAVYRHAAAPLASVSERTFPGPADDVPVRLYIPATDAAGPLPCLVFFHGGGWVVGDLETHDHVCRYLAHGAGVCVIAVDYRLAPEHPFPSGFEDCLAAVHWAAGNAASLNIDPQRLAIGGDSAGGNLAAAVAIALRDGGGPALALQLLFYPATDMTADNASLRENAEGFLLTRAAMELFMNWYVPNPANRSDPRASPQLANHHRDLPRAFILTAEFDPLRDEARAYAETLAADGCPTAYKCYPGMLHGFIRMGGIVDRGLNALDDACGALRDALGKAPD
jgi:acetyl esterase